MIRRIPAAIRRIEDITDEPRVSVVGTVIKRGEAEFMLDDGTGQLTVITPEDPAVSERDVVRVIGKVYGTTLEAEIVCPLKDINMQLYIKMYELRKRIYGTQ
ncbi:MAG: hypothetical protein HXS41_04550 [Theionarchaea archaeon]|nr:hypothetical protein [Theionarchaea archaeon]MBU6999529.1 hypothetical protein [Theionarchaea archaeon]MBU7020307.1 hypothetical protein [Theionarchaea archaeon]MBU7035561.1 hypothetical protein [Theionarchaea archaeon]MBU7041191.1 hypothetical protein [Theionarchaea archaeon]